MAGEIKIVDGMIVISDLKINNQDIIDYFNKIPEMERQESLIKALEVGIFCLERTASTQDLDFVKRKVEGLLSQVQESVSTIPQKTQDELIGKLGTDKGQVLEPVKILVESTTQGINAKLDEVRKMLSDNIDPAKETTILAKALSSIKNLLDPQRNDSIQSTFSNAINNVTAEGGSLASSVKNAVDESIKSLKSQVDELAKEIRGETVAANALQNTTAKGDDFEEEVLEVVTTWAEITGAEINHVGVDNKPGDILVILPENPAVRTGTKIIIEARDRQETPGRKAINDTMTKAMAERDADMGIFLTRKAMGLAKEIGEWSEGRCDKGPIIATCFEHLKTALRLLIIMKQLEFVNAEKPEVDSTAIITQLTRIRTALQKITTINRKVTDIKETATGIQGEAESLREDIRSALGEIDEAIRIASLRGSTSAA